MLLCHNYDFDSLQFLSVTQQSCTSVISLAVVTTELKNTTLTHPLFSFDTYPTLQNISDVQTQPIETTAPIYYSHIYGSLRSTVQGNITQFRYIPTINTNISFQIWNMTAEGDPQIKAVLQVVPEVSGGDIKVAIVNIAIDVGDMIGVWVEHYYPVGMLRLYNQNVTDYLVVYNGWDSQIQPEDAGLTDIESVIMSANSRDSSAFMAAVEVTVTYEVKGRSNLRTSSPSTHDIHVIDWYSTTTGFLSESNNSSGPDTDDIHLILMYTVCVVVAIIIAIVMYCYRFQQSCSCHLRHRHHCCRRKNRTSQYPQPTVNRAYQRNPRRSNGAQAQVNFGVIQETDVKPRRNLDDNKKKQNIPPRLFTRPLHWNLGKQEVKLEHDTAEFSRVHYKFRNTCTSRCIKITEIVRIQNECLYTQYRAQKSTVEEELSDHPSIVVERELWHGTTANSVNQICANGFDMSFAGKNGTAFGRGLYFSTTSQYSLRYSKDYGERYMILAKVVTGRYQLGSKQTHVKVLKQDCHSAVNILSRPAIFVVYDNAAAYPEYVIKFRQPSV